MASQPSSRLWQALRPILSIVVLLLLSLLWGDEGCGKGPRTGLELFGEHSAYWIVPILVVIAIRGIIADRMRAEWALVVHLMAFLGAMYLGFGSFIYLMVMLLAHPRWPAPICTLIIVVLLVDCARQLVLSFVAVMRTPSAQDAKPVSILRQLGPAIGLIGLTFLSTIPQNCASRRSRSAPPAPPGDAKERAVKIGPPRSLPFANRAAFTELTEQHAPIFGKLPFGTEVPMWRGTVFHAPRGAGFGRHIPQASHLMQGGEWLLVHADSGLWFLDTENLTRRARLNTGSVAAVDVSQAGDLIAYADCASSADAWSQPCDLVVLRFPALTELHRSEIPYPKQLRFSPKAKLIAVSRGHFGGATVIAVGGQALFTARILSAAVAAIPLSETRVAYIGGSGELCVEDANRKEPLYLGSGDAPVMTFPFKLGIGRTSGELVFDEAADRVLEIGSQGALVLEGVSSDKPQLGKPLTHEEIDASGLRHGARNHSGEGLDARFNVKQFRYGWQVDGIEGFVAARGEVVGIHRHRIVRATREGVMRSIDFDDSESNWQTHSATADLVLWHLNNDDQVTVRRVDLSVPVTDYTPEVVGVFDSGYSPKLMSFSNGDRAFLAIDDDHRSTLVRLPRGGKLSPVEPLSVSGLHSPRSQMAAEGRYVFLSEAGQVLEITDKTTQLLTTDGHWPEQLSFDAKAHCFVLSEGRNRRLIGPGCAPPR